MCASMWEELGGRAAATVFGFLIGAVLTWLLGRWRRRQQRHNILRGRAHDTVVIEQHVVESGTGPEGQRRAAGLRVRSLGQGEIHDVVPNPYLAAELLRRALRVTSRDTLISMQGAEGSFLLETLTHFVGDRLGNAPFEHDLYVMAPCCEPAELAQHQPSTVLLIAAADLALFEDWQACRDIEVEHGSDGARVLTLMELARRFRREREEIARLKAAGQRTRFVETMYLLDLALDKRYAVVPMRNVPWGRFEAILKAMNLE
jgi:uncharacterized small protein (DUF1192 family)